MYLAAHLLSVTPELVVMDMLKRRKYNLTGEKINPLVILNGNVVVIDGNARIMNRYDSVFVTTEFFMESLIRTMSTDLRLARPQEIVDKAYVIKALKENYENGV